MRRIFLYLATPVLVVTVMGCNKAPEPPQPMAQDTAPPSAAVASTQPATAAYDLQFLDTMTKHHASAVEMASMAKGNIQQAGLKKLVTAIPSDQQKEIDQMKAWREQWYPGAPSAENMTMPGMSSSMNMDMSHMQSMKPGPDYDLMFIDMMTPHHQSAITMAQDALVKAAHPEIKTLAQQIIDAQTKEIAQMTTIKASLKK